jgi:serine/threonine-protein kinase
MDDTFIGKKIHQYKIIRRLGTGGLGEVYEATDTKLERLVALKCLSPSSLSPADERVSCA